MEQIAFMWDKILKDVVDIAVSSYIFYRLLKLFRGTRAVQVVIGVIFVAVLSIIAIYALELPVTGWILSKFWYAGIIVFVVVFQPELRAALAHLGSHSWSRLIIPDEFNFIKELLQSVKACVEANMGALIVLEQEVGLRNFIETGTVINGQLTKELVISIFNTKSPLHDGAVIIQKSRLIAAGCLLPLSNNPGISKILGTRHRAAVGLTEISDSQVIVVSEETGMISLAKEGKLEWGITLEKLNQTLVEYYRKHSRNK